MGARRIGFVVVVLLLLVTACGGPSDADIAAMVEGTVDARVAEQVSAMATDFTFQATMNAPMPSTPLPQPTAVPTDEEPTPEPVPPTPTPEPIVTAAAPYDTDAANKMVMTINGYRVSQNLWPFAINDALTRLAQVQLDYLMGLTELPFDIHVGQQGEGPKQRARWENWPTYNTDEQILIDEIGYVGFDENRALGWWLDSNIHFNTLNNTAYREMGIAVAEHKWGFFYIVVFGGRPNVLPALYDPDNAIFYLTSEQHWYADNDEFIQNPTSYQFVKDANAPADPGAWLEWERTVPAPQDMGNVFTIIYTDGVTEARYEINLGKSVAWLPGSIDVGGE